MLSGIKVRLHRRVPIVGDSMYADQFPFSEFVLTRLTVIVCLHDGKAVRF
jgi:hypothetical protein